MKRILIVLVVAALALAGLAKLGVVPSGTFKATQVCTDCGMTRAAECRWIGSRGWAVQTDALGAEPTPLSEFLKRAGAAPNPAHLWRDYAGTRQGSAGAEPLAQEEVLARLDPALAAQAVRARLSLPSLDALPEGMAPGWFKVRGWPPATAEEARAWWAGNRP